jgi:VID27 N-terminal region/VID27 C-terminal WD40-like domain/VID27 PH-like domain
LNSSGANCLAVGKWFFGDASKESVIDIPDGQLYIVRPLSLKGYSELIYKDARASVRRTGTEFQYQLVITRVFEEGEEELLDEDAGDDADVEALVNDEQSFLLDEALQFRVDIRDTGEKVFAWRDLSGAKGDLWEFVCDTSTKAETVESFELIAVRCQYERKYKKSADDATEEDLHQFVFTEEPIPSASPVLSPSASHSPAASPSHTSTRLHDHPVKEEQPDNSTKLSGKGASTSSANIPPGTNQMPRQPEGHGNYTREIAELHLFDFETGVFVIQDQATEAVVMDLGNWNYWLKVSTKNRTWIGRSVEDDLNPVFNFEYLSAIFNVYGSDSSAYSWLLRFKDKAELENFQQGLMQALWEHNNQVKWAKLKDDDQDYILEAFKDLAMSDAGEDLPDEDEEESEEDEDRPSHQSEQYDSDESQDDEVTQPKDGNTNSQLAVGQKHDRAFVVRGSKIGVFKNTDDNQLQFITNISKVQTPKGKLFSPKKVMLHAGDSNMVLQNADNPNSVYRMDLEAGKIVDEWKVHDDIPINTFAPETVSIISRFLLQSTDQVI